LKANQYGFVKSFLHKPLSREDLSTIIDIDWSENYLLQILLLTFDKNNWLWPKGLLQA
jgi:hypothetical protein